MKNTRPLAVQAASALYDDDFFDDMLGLFPDHTGYAPKKGACGKYMYDNGDWDDIIKHEHSYYIPWAERELLDAATKEISAHIPPGIPYVDFGSGGANCFLRNASKLITTLNSKEYVGVDFCSNSLSEIKGLAPEYKGQVNISTYEMDLFFPTNKTFYKNRPALGVANGLTVCNAHGLVKNGNGEENLIALLKYLSQLCGHGWLLLTIDTNQDEISLQAAYKTPAVERFCTSVLHRMARDLPVKGFNPHSFKYTPEFQPDIQALAHFLEAIEEQAFTLGPYPIHVEKGQKIHLVNSYKWRREFFESCCARAGLSVTKSWDHETGMMLYLLKDDRCSVASDLTENSLYRRAG